MRVIMSCALAGALVYAQPALAEEETEDVALLAYLGLTAAEGKTTLGDKAGELEGYILTSGLLNNVAVEVRKDIGSALSRDPAITDQTRLIPLAGDQRLTLSSYYLARSRLRALDRTASSELPSICPQRAREGGRDRIKGVDLKAADVVGAFKTDTSITGYTIDPGVQLVINAISADGVDLAGKKFRLGWWLPDELGVIAENSELLGLYTKVLDNAAPYAAGKCDKAYVDQANAIIAATKAVAAPGDDGAPSLLESGMLLEGLLAGGGAPQVLRVDVEKAGGSLINRSNIFTQLGFNGLTISGGMIVTYRLVDPASGTVRLSNTLICHHPQRSLGQVAREGPGTAGKCVRAH